MSCLLTLYLLCRCNKYLTNVFEYSANVCNFFYVFKYYLGMHIGLEYLNIGNKVL